MEDRLEIWLELIAGKLDRLIELGENVERASRSHEMPEEWGEHEADHFAGADKMVAEGPNNLRISIARELEGYRLVNDSDIGKIVEVQNSTADPWRECTLLAIDWDRPYGFICGHVGFYRPMQWRFARIKIEPAKEPDHLAGPMPDPGEGYRILSKNPLEDLTPGDEFEDCNGEWIRSSNAETNKKQGSTCWYRRKIEQPERLAGPMPDPGEGYRILSKDPPEELQEGDEYEMEKGIWVKSANACVPKRQDKDIWYRRKIEPVEPPKPAWEPKVGDWVKVTRPENWGECSAPRWDESMHQFDGKVGQIERELEGRFYIDGFIASNGWQYQFHPDWLSPAEPPQPEYREPVLPADAGEPCEFSMDGKHWYESLLSGFQVHNNPWISSNLGRWNHARINKDS